MAPLPWCADMMPCYGNLCTQPESFWACILYVLTYNCSVMEIRETIIFTEWMKRLRDIRARQRIVSRIQRLAIGNLGDVKPVGEGISELRVDYGPGYRIYFVQQGNQLVILLCGGDKKTQDSDIKKAKAMAHRLEL